MATFAPKGVCSQAINFEVIGGKVRNVSFEQGCNGNGKGIAALVEGMDASEAISKLKGTTCGKRKTSCPDQLAIALEGELQRARD